MHWAANTLEIAAALGQKLPPMLTDVGQHSDRAVLLSDDQQRLVADDNRVEVTRVGDVRYAADAKPVMPPNGVELEPVELGIQKHLGGRATV